MKKRITDGGQAKKVVEETLNPLRKTTNIDTLVLGCTHYPLLENVIQNIMGQDVKIISSGEKTARETSIILEIENLLYTDSRTPTIRFIRQVI